MASMVVKASSNTCSDVCPAMSVREKGSKNKRKFWADTHLNGLNEALPLPHNECPSYEFFAEKFETTLNHVPPGACDILNCGHDYSNYLKPDLGLPSALGLSDVGPSHNREEGEANEFQDADWNDLTESQLEELVLSNLDAIFKNAIRKIVACGYSKEVATKVVLSSGLFYGCKDPVSNVVDNTLAYLRNGQEIDSLREHCFEDLQQLEKYVLAELICVLREVRPFFSTGDAMWSLLICDMNISHAFAMDSGPLSSFLSDGTPNVSSSTPPPPSETETKSTETSLANLCKPISTTPYGTQLDMDTVAAAPNFIKPVNSPDLHGLTSEKVGSTFSSVSVDKPFCVTGTSKTPALEEKFVSGRKIYSNSSKKESILRQKSVHLEKSYRTYGIEGASRAGKLSGLGGLILDKKLKSVSDSAAAHIKSASVKNSKAMGVDVPHDIGSINLSTKSMSSSSSSYSFDIDAIHSTSSIPKTINPPATPFIKSMLSSNDTELSLSLATKRNPSPMSISCNSNTPNYSFAGIPYDKSLGQWEPQSKKDEMIMKLVPRLQELQNQLQEWKEWANQKIMQATHRLSKDKAELNTLRQEKEEVERLKKERQTLEENTIKKLSEMENALSKATGQVERANAAVKRLKVENAALRQEMESAKLQAVESAAGFQEVSKREKKTQMKFQTLEKQKRLFQEELAAERRKLAQLPQQLEQAQDLHLQLEARWKEEEKAKEELLRQANSVIKEREQLEASAKSKVDMIRSKAEAHLQKYRDDIQKLEQDISQLRLKSNSSKIAALKRGVDGSYVSKLSDCKISRALKETGAHFLSATADDCDEGSGMRGVKRERECVMCLTEEMSVVFLPCAHQVVCTMCNKLHEERGMKDCPSCRSPIEQRICAKYAHP